MKSVETTVIQLDIGQSQTGAKAESERSKESHITVGDSRVAGGDNDELQAEDFDQARILEVKFGYIYFV